MIASSRVKPGASTVSPSHRRIRGGPDSQPRPSRILPSNHPSGDPASAVFDVIPVYRDCLHFPFGNYLALFELKTYGSNRAFEPQLQALGGKGRFRKNRPDFPFGKRMPCPVPASSADRLPSVNAAPLPDGASDLAMLPFSWALPGHCRRLRLSPAGSRWRRETASGKGESVRLCGLQPCRRGHPAGPPRLPP